LVCPNTINCLIHIFLKKYKPTNPSSRFKNLIIRMPFDKKIKTLSACLKSKSGRNVKGCITVYRKGRSLKTRFIFLENQLTWDKHLYFISKIFNFKKKLYSLQKHTNGSFSYSSLAHGSTIGQILFTSNMSRKFWYNYNPGNIVFLGYLKRHSIFFNLFFSNKCTYARSAGTFCQLKETNDSLSLGTVVLPSGSLKIVSLFSLVKLGRCANIFNKKIIYGKAGYLAFKGKKPKNRGVARNPVDHPHGGNTKTNSPEVSPWGWVAKRNK
jgi:large subunit ribosomal protein L2